MSKAHFILRLATLLILGLLVAGLIDRSDRKDLNLTEIEQVKLEAVGKDRLKKYYFKVVE